MKAWILFALKATWYLTQGALVCGCMLVVLMGASRHGPAGSPWVDLASHFQWQYFLCATAALAVALVYRMRVATGVAVAAVVFQSVALAPLYWDERAEAAPSLRVAVFNTWRGRSLPIATRQWLDNTDADVIVFQEATAGWPKFAKLLKDEYPHQHLAVCENYPRRSVLTISRLPFESVDQINMPPIDLPVLRCVVEADGARVAVYNVHMPFSWGPRRADFQDTLVQALEDEPLPYVLAGDFNATVWSPVQQELVRDAGVRRAASGSGVYGSWPVSGYPLLRRFGGTRADSSVVDVAAGLARYFGIGIDRTYVSDGIAVVDFQLGPALGSDHLPHYTDLFVKPRHDTIAASTTREGNDRTY